jgi:hypothetical protein
MKVVRYTHWLLLHHFEKHTVRVCCVCFFYVAFFCGFAPHAPPPVLLFFLFSKDVVYPASPFFLATASPETLRRMLLPLLAYANNETAAYGMPKDYNYDWYDAPF